MEDERSYSGLFIVTPEKEESAETLKETISSVISENSGKIVNVNMVGKKKLAYPIKKNTEGIYMEFTFTALPEGIAKMSRLFRINTDILRALIHADAK